MSLPPQRYHTRLEDSLHRRVGVGFIERADTIRDDKRPVPAVTGMPDRLLKHFFKRRAVIETRYRHLAADYRHTHGHEPPTDVHLKFAQQATLKTRDAKTPPRSLADKLTAWRAEASTIFGPGGVATLNETPFRPATWSPHPGTCLLIDLQLPRSARCRGTGHLEHLRPHRRDRMPAPAFTGSAPPLTAQQPA